MGLPAAKPPGATLRGSLSLGPSLWSGLAFGHRSASLGQISGCVKYPKKTIFET